MKLAAQAFYVGVMACALLSLVTLLRHGPPSPAEAALHLTGWAVVAYFTLVFAVLFGSTRFHHPLAPWLAVYAAWWRAGAAGAVSRPMATARLEVAAAAAPSRTK